MHRGANRVDDGKRGKEIRKRVLQGSRSSVSAWFNVPTEGSNDSCQGLRNCITSSPHKRQKKEGLQNSTRQEKSDFQTVFAQGVQYKLKSGARTDSLTVGKPEGHPPSKTVDG